MYMGMKEKYMKAVVDDKPYKRYREDSLGLTCTIISTLKLDDVIYTPEHFLTAQITW